MSSEFKRILIIELWGMGDAILMSSVIPELLNQNYRVSILCKPSNCTLLASFYPEVNFIPFHFPWTAYKQFDKYRLWNWPWKDLKNLIYLLRNHKFHVGISVRKDPRDHILMHIAGVGLQYGYPHRLSWMLLNNKIAQTKTRIHRVEEWQNLVKAVTGSQTTRGSVLFPGKLKNPMQSGNPPTWVIHCGAGQPSRRWPVEYYEEILPKLKARYRFNLEIIPDDDGFGKKLESLADRMHSGLTLELLVDILDRASLFLGNDSGPGHLAAALGTPVISFFGPTYPAWFAPHGNNHLVLGGKYSNPFPDHCQHPSNPPYAMEALTPDLILETLTKYLDTQIQPVIREV